MGHRIQNFEALATNDLRRDALSIAEAGYAAIDTGGAVLRKLRIEEDTLCIGDARFPLANRRVSFVGVGKCALAAAEAVEKLLGDRLTDGIALDVASSQPRHLEKITAYIGTHPLPSETNVDATKRIVEFLSGRTAGDLVLMLVSGGGSTLLCLPDGTMTCTDESTLFSDLTARGALIQDMNTVRKHTSKARGGGLAFASYPAEVVSLIVSDVPGNDISSIASGPTVKDTSTVSDANAVLTRYDVTASAGVELRETPKEQKYFERVTNILFLTNEDALRAMQEEAKMRGYRADIVDTHFAGEARATGRAVLETLHAESSNTVLLYAGESTVVLSAAGGHGGRSHEMALAVLEYLNPDELILPFASDGRDNTEHAGAIADAVTREHAKVHSLSVAGHLEAHLSYDFFDTTGDALITGYTGSNVSDIIIAMKK